VVYVARMIAFRALCAATAVSIASASMNASADPAAGEPAAPTHDSGAEARTIGWVSIALGSEAAVVAAVTSILILHQKGVRDDNCTAQRVCSQTGLDANSTIDTLLGWNAASWIVAAAGLGAGVALVLTHRPHAEKSVAVGVSPTAGGMALGVRGTF
jgi:hypothetical protein